MRLTSMVHILSPETDNFPSWISGRERMTVENISWSISTKECCRPRWGLNPRPPGLQSDGASDWATEAGCLTVIRFLIILLFTSFIIQELICSTVNGLAFSSATDFDLPFSTVFAQSEATDFAASGATDFTTSVATDLTPLGITIYLLW